MVTVAAENTHGLDFAIGLGGRLITAERLTVVRDEPLNGSGESCPVDHRIGRRTYDVN